MGFPQFSKKLSNETLSILSNGDTKPLLSLLEDLQREISVKDNLLHRNDEELLELRENVKQYRRDLNDLRKKSIGGHHVGNHEIVCVNLFMVYFFFL